MSAYCSMGHVRSPHLFIDRRAVKPDLVMRNMPVDEELVFLVSFGSLPGHRLSVPHRYRPVCVSTVPSSGELVYSSVRGRRCWESRVTTCPGIQTAGIVYQIDAQLSHLDRSALCKVHQIQSERKQIRHFSPHPAVSVTSTLSPITYDSDDAPFQLFVFDETFDLFGNGMSRYESKLGDNL